MLFLCSFDSTFLCVYVSFPLSYCICAVVVVVVVVSPLRYLFINMCVNSVLWMMMTRLTFESYLAESINLPRCLAFSDIYFELLFAVVNATATHLQNM